MLFSIVYVSSAASELSTAQLLEILEVSRRKNTRHAITGLLLYKGGNFMQVLEGDRAPVEETYRKILLDARHRGVIELASEEIAARDFGEWSMGFRDLDDPQTAHIPGFSEFLNTPLNDPGFTDTSHRGRLLRTFKRNM